MTRYLTIFFLVVLSTSKAQIKIGHYFSNSQNGQNIQFIFLEKDHLQFIIEKDTLGGYGTEKNGIILSTKYVIDSAQIPNRFDVIFYDAKSGNELKVMKGIYKQIDDYSLLLNINMLNNERPNDLNIKSSDVLQLTLNSPENYINLLKLNDQNTIIGFTPMSKENILGNGAKEIIYFQNSEPLNSTEFQTKEIYQFNSDGMLLSKTLFDHYGNLFDNTFGYCKKVISYNSSKKIVSEQYFSKNGELMKYAGGNLYPETKYYYNDTALVKMTMNINNEKYINKAPAKILFLFDSYNDPIGWESFLYDGTKILDTIKTVRIEQFTKWILEHSKYPETFESIIFGGFSEGYRSSNNGKVKNSETYNIYSEFYLNDSSNTKHKLTYYFQLDYEFKVIGIRPKKNTEGNQHIDSWSSIDYSNWIKLYGRPLSKAESDMERSKQKEILKEALDTIDQAIENNNTDPNIRIETQASKKTLKKVRKHIKKSMTN